MYNSAELKLLVEITGRELLAKIKETFLTVILKLTSLLVKFLNLDYSDVFFLWKFIELCTEDLSTFLYVCYISGKSY